MRRRRTISCILCIILAYNIAFSESRESTACAAKTKPCSIHNLTCAREEVITVTHAAFGYKKDCPKDHVFHDCSGQDIGCCQWLDSDTIVKFSETLISDLKHKCSSRSSCTLFTSDLDRENSPSFTYSIIEYSCHEPETVHIGAIIIGVLAAVNVIVIVMVIIAFLVIRRQEKRSLYIRKSRTQDQPTGEGPQYFTVESSVSLPRNQSLGYDEGAVGGASPTTTAIIHEQPKNRDITKSPKSSTNRELPNRRMGSSSLRSNPASENLYSETTFIKDSKKSKNKWNAAHDDDIDVLKPGAVAGGTPSNQISKIIDRPRMDTPPPTLEKKPPLLKPKSDREFMEYCAKNNPFRNKSDRLTTDRDVNSNKSKSGGLKDRDSNGDRWELGVTKVRDLNSDRWKARLDKDRDVNKLKVGLEKDRDLNGDRWKPVIKKDRDLNGEKWKSGLHKDSDRWESGLSKDLTGDRRTPELTKPRALNDFVGKDRDLKSDKLKRESTEYAEVRSDRKTAKSALPKDSIHNNLAGDRELGDSESQKTDVTESSDGSFVEDIDAMLRQKGISVLNEKQRCILSARIDRMNR